jgi:hypothetical protein
MEKTLACGENRGKSWKYVAQWKLWESTYDADIALPVKAGIRRIRVENHGADWVAVKSYTFTGCRTKEEQSVICCALASASAAVLWIQNSDSTWLNHASDASQIRTFPPAEYILEGFADGSCEVEWWETWTGSVLRRERVQALNGQLRLNPGPLATDVAARIRY